MSTPRLSPLVLPISAGHHDAAGHFDDKFSIELDGGRRQPGHGRRIDRPACEKMKNRFGDEVRMGRFAGFDLFLRPHSVTPSKSSCAVRTVTPESPIQLGTIRSVETTVQGFEEPAKLGRHRDSTSAPQNLKPKLARPLKERYQVEPPERD
jgi:hypothetical protein